MLAVKINDPWLEEHLTAAAKSQGKSRSALTREVLDRYLEDLEDYQDAVAVMADIESGKSKTFTLEEVEAELGLAH